MKGNLISESSRGLLHSNAKIGSGLKKEAFGLSGLQVSKSLITYDNIAVCQEICLNSVQRETFKRCGSVALGVDASILLASEFSAELQNQHFLLRSLLEMQKFRP